MWSDQIVEAVLEGLRSEYDVARRHEVEWTWDGNFVGGGSAKRDSLVELADFASEHEIQLRTASSYLALRRDGQDVAYLTVSLWDRLGRSLDFAVESTSSVLTAGLHDRVEKLVKRAESRQTKMPETSATNPQAATTNIYHGPVTQGSGNVVSSVSGSTNSQATASSGAPVARPSWWRRFLKGAGDNLMLTVVTVVATVGAGLILANYFGIGR
jgi:hypothetical protein